MTKKIVIILLFLFATKPIFAKCKAGGFQFYPEQKEIRTNSMFIIQGFAKSQKTIENLKNETIFLQSKKGELIELKLQEILKGQMNLTQAIFKPSKKLEPNTIYYLKHSNDSIKGKNKFTKWNSETKKYERVYWSTTSQTKTNSLNSNITIILKKTEFISYGCGPSVNAIFNVKNESGHEIWYKTELIELSSGEKTIYYIKELNGNLNIGHGMCGGAFSYKKEGKYKVKFTLMDIAGEALKSTNWITFNSPYLDKR